ncbi:aminotransferase-like domain-containing protein [Noviherbaspirillum autotrophicum]|uniref:GntR family transcriptional regulator n=1 Tax=Noviherbaspirillum autotrophicum TaxID=709839 RepID=A0A0C2BVE7_9BURK|nr:PLP-dependent aminotransferase family protein [Noviherbaspirillum autotrophicum]KIF81635.1 GntR family transcriptional regulator [Noviherbaspirillum autotrophicum]KIF81996.1 GntR family transcriptional regulator [Noviherbaspirillum autotrophicum]KIF84118.1 GntR family transcriptional regulator [Noviherbaspirillum autotrophicum]
MKRYEALAEEIAQSIRTGVMKLGDRLPSVRQASTSRGVSPSTVFEAYYLLEARGLIRARERSGYYVTAGAKSLPPEPDISSQPSGDSTNVDVSQLVFDVLESLKTRDVIPFGSAFPSPLLFPLQRLARSMASSVQEMDPWSTVDDLTPGNAALRRQIALRYLADGLHIHTDEIVITNGALEALNLCLQAVTRPGDCVLIESPTFYAALQALERVGLKAIEVPTHPREGVDLEAMALALERHKPKACWLMTNFQNPLGSLMSDEKKQALVELLTSHDVPLIEDDVYGELYFGSKRPISAKAFDTKGLVMHCASFSKCLAPGYRIGWAVPGRFTQRVARLKVTTTLSASAPAQAALADYLAKGGYDKHLRQLRHALSVQQSAMVQAVVRHFPKGTKATRPSGGYFLWIELPGKINTLEVHRQAFSLGISIAPGPMFSAHRGFANCLRLNYGHPWDERTEAALTTLGRLIAANMEAKRE